MAAHGPNDYIDRSFARAHEAQRVRNRARHAHSSFHPDRTGSHSLFGISYEDIKGTSFESKMTKRQLASLVCALTLGSLFCIAFGA